MKFIHCADVHLGAKMDSKLSFEQAKERQRELRSAFANMVEYAKSERAEAIVLSGDIFDSDRPLKKDKEFFYSVVKNNPEIYFLYLRGNHDGLQSYEETPENLFTFSDKWRSYAFGGVVFSGIEITKENCVSLYSSLNLDKDKKNIVILHGQAGDAVGAGKINLLKLKDKYIDYLALGHVHSCCIENLDGRGVYAYPGCLEGRGFDEEGEKGFILAEAGERVQAKFIPFAARTVHIAEVDVSPATNGYEAYSLIKKSLRCKKSDILRVVLTGEVCFDNSDLAAETEKRLQCENYYYAEVKDRTERKIDFSAYEGDITLKGEFVRLVSADKNLSGERKREIISLGLRALDGREVEV